MYSVSFMDSFENWSEFDVSNDSEIEYNTHNKFYVFTDFQLNEKIF